MTEQAQLIRVESRELKITRPGKILFPEDGFTKGDLIQYYQRIGRWMLPYLKNRPLAMQRFPDGINRPGFFQKSVASYYPRWIETTTVKKVGGTVKHALCNDAATLVYLANQACVTPHVWLSRADTPDFPDQMIFDLDPSGEALAPVISAAHMMKELLDTLDLPAYVKSTGSRGLHVVVPLDRRENFQSVREFARELAEILIARDPGQYTLEQYKNKRRGRVFIDINRNAYAQTAVAPYAVRAWPGAPVAIPLDWAELGRKGFSPASVTIENVFDRLQKIEDPWKGFQRRAASLNKARRRFQDLHVTQGIPRKAKVRSDTRALGAR